jgi:hypothetical protein
MKTRLPLPFGFRWVGPWLLLTILAWLAPSTAVALTDTACLLDGGLCDASNACVRYKTGPEGELLREEVGMCEATGGNGGPLDGPQNPPLKPAEAIELTFTAYIPTALPGARRIQGDPCRGLEPWMRLRQGPFKKDDAMV